MSLFLLNIWDISLKSLSLKEAQLLLNIKSGYSLPFLFTCFLTCETVSKTGVYNLLLDISSTTVNQL